MVIKEITILELKGYIHNEGGGDFIAMQGKYAVSLSGKSEGQQNDPCTSIIIILLLLWDLDREWRWLWSLTLRTQSFHLK